MWSHGSGRAGGAAALTGSEERASAARAAGARVGLGRAVKELGTALLVHREHLRLCLLPQPFGRTGGGAAAAARRSSTA